MTAASRAPYDSERLAAAYAHDRPPLHERILSTIAADIGITTPVPLALDIGCGAGLSTVALLPHTERVVGIDPSIVMVAAGRRDVPGITLLVGDAERLPFRASGFNLVTAAGAINYTDRSRSVPELSRVLAPGGTIALYDFGEGTPDSKALADWQQAFDRRLPRIEGYALDVRTLEYEASGLTLTGFRDLRIPIAMTMESYLAFAMSSTRIEVAIARGDSERRIREWCEESLPAVFDRGALDVLFVGYVAYVRHQDG